MDWVNAEIFDLSFKDGREVVSKLPNQVLTIADAGYKIVITTWGNTSNNKSHSTSQHTSLTVELDAPIDISSFQEKFMIPLTDLIQLGSSHLNSVRYINVIPVGQTKECKLHISSIFKRIEYSRESYLEWVLFYLSEFTDSYEGLVKDWLNLHKKVPHIFKLYFDSMYISNQFPVSKFLNVVQALESFHAEYSEENTVLRYRLTDLLDQSRDALSDLIQDREEFLNNIMDTRNYYTHYSSDKKMKSAVGFRLEALTHVSRLLLDYHFLVKCNLSHEKAKSIINRGAYGAAIESFVKSNKFWKNKETEKSAGVN